MSATHTMQRIAPYSNSDQSQTVLIQKIRGMLWSIYKFPVTNIAEVILNPTFLGCELQIMLLFRQSIATSKKYEYLCKYVELIDLLLYNANFNVMLHTYLLQFYTDIFNYLAKYQHYNAIDRVKVCRKYWVGRIHPRLYQDLRDIVMRRSKTDIEDISINGMITVRNYYFSVGFIEEDVRMHLPRLYQHEARQQMNSNFSTIKDYKNQSEIVDNKLNERTIYKIKRDVNINDSQQTYTNTRLNTSSAKQIKLNSNIQSQLNIDNKRIRYESQQTNLGSSSCNDDDLSVNIEIFRKCRIISKANDQFINIKSILNKLKSLNQFQCKECGIRFNIKDHYDQHIELHFKQKLAQFQKSNNKNKKYNANNKATYFATLEQWIKKQQQIDQNYNVVITKNDHFIQQCGLCGQQLPIGFQNENWIINGAVKASINQCKPIKAHKKCFDELLKDDDSTFFQK